MEDYWKRIKIDRKAVISLSRQSQQKKKRSKNRQKTPKRHSLNSN